jgi:hypothetical protein
MTQKTAPRVLSFKTLPRAPLWFNIFYSAFVLVVIAVYWVKYGPANFLWFSDIAFFGMAYALWRDDARFTSMMAIGVLPLEFIWAFSYFSGFFSADGQTWMGVADYMFDAALPLWLRALSWFHFMMIGAVIYMLLRKGYDKGALIPQTILALAVLAATHMWGIKEDNPNMIYPPGNLDEIIPQPIYSALQPIVLFGCIILPMHLLLKKYWPLKSAAAARGARA